ncbi:MAG: phosphoribosylformylglycinamidine synthase subunit PurQ / glutaminase [Candidatus Atribacteria bacterium]|nr:phosphoribosylformylglycinamidine synthase subunit PurQ / glutaminase [Candidatus Atribacteria bacterium]
MKFGVVVFPGSNCDHDCYYALSQVVGVETTLLWHQERDLKNCDAVVLPGGFSYGDYLRTGAIARFSPIMDSIRQFAQAGGLVLGICNGFQILLESGLLPGALLPNRSGHFICRFVYLRVENNRTPFTSLFQLGEVLKIPIAHNQGNFFASSTDIRSFLDNRQVVFRYCDSRGEVTEVSNPNGSLESIAGLTNCEGNVMGMMPHPERSAEEILGSTDGKKVFQSIVKWWEEKEIARK